MVGDWWGRPGPGAGRRLLFPSHRKAGALSRAGPLGRYISPLTVAPACDTSLHLPGAARLLAGPSGALASEGGATGDDVGRPYTGPLWPGSRPRSYDRHGRRSGAAPGHSGPCGRAAEAPGAPDAAQFAPPVARPGVAAWHRRGAYPGGRPSGGSRCMHRMQRVPGGLAHGPMMEPPSRPDRATARLGPWVIQLFPDLVYRFFGRGAGAAAARAYPLLAYCA